MTNTPQAAEPLMPCPFCPNGGNPKMECEYKDYPNDKVSVVWAHILCSVCLSSSNEFSSIKQAITAWNTRPEAASAVVDALADIDHALEILEIGGTLSKSEIRSAQTSMQKIRAAQRGEVDILQNLIKQFLEIKELARLQGRTPDYRQLEGVIDSANAALSVRGGK